MSRQNFISASYSVPGDRPRYGSISTFCRTEAGDRSLPSDRSHYWLRSATLVLLQCNYFNATTGCPYAASIVQEYEMQTLEKPDLKPSNQSELIAVYLGYRIVLKRIWVKGVDKGWWLHWSHPHDQGKKDPVKFGQFLPDQAMLPTVLEQVKSVIEATVALDCLEPPPPVARPAAQRHWTERLRAWLN